MIRIDRLNLKLPSCFEGRAQDIVQRIGVELARYPVSQNEQYEHIALQQLHMDTSASNQHVAMSVASQIHRQAMGSGRKNRG